MDEADLDEAIAWAKRCPSLALRLDRDPPLADTYPRPDKPRAAGLGHAARQQRGRLRTAERVARESYGRLVAFLAARTRDIAGAEDALAEAFAAALRIWPADGVPLQSRSLAADGRPPPADRRAAPPHHAQGRARST